MLPQITRIYTNEIQDFASQKRVFLGKTQSFFLTAASVFNQLLLVFLINRRQGFQPLTGFGNSSTLQRLLNDYSTSFNQLDL